MKNYKFADTLADMDCFTITKIYDNESKAGKKYCSFYIKGDDENIYTTSWMGLAKWKTPVNARMVPKVVNNKIFYNFEFIVPKKEEDVPFEI